MQSSLRPKTFNTFIGQTKLKKTLMVMIKSAQTRKDTLDHILFHGQAGMGKTSLATIIAKVSDSQIRYAQGPMLEKKSDILSLFSAFDKRQIIFIDEIHGLNKSIAELLYSVLEDNVMDIIIGPEGQKKIIRVKVPPFTLIGATTKMASIPTPLRDRFGLVSKLFNYSQKELQKILNNSAKTLKWAISDKASALIASNSNSSPRVANNFLRRCIDFAHVEGHIAIDLKVVRKTFSTIGVYHLGLLDQQITYLQTLDTTFSNKWVSVDLIAGVLFETKENIEYNLEPSLLKNQLLLKSSRGRKISAKGKIYLSNITSMNKL